MPETIIERFAASLDSPQETVLRDVTDYIHWDEEQGGDDFTPDATDDVAIRTYLLDRHIHGATDATLDRLSSSLRYFYTWLKTNNLIAENPFEKFDLERPFLTPEQIRVRHEAFPGQPDKREVAGLRALNRLAAVTNQASDVQSMLNDSLETLLEVMTLNTAWISLKYDSMFLNKPDMEPPAHGFFLAAAHNLPPSLEQSDRIYLRRPPQCNCQKLLSKGRLKRGVNIVECSRLQDAAKTGSENNDLKFHASVPIICNDQAIGVINVASEEWLLLSASDLQFLTTGAKQIGSALERARLYDEVQDQHDLLKNELTMARNLQVSLMPKKLPKIPGYSLAAYWKPARVTSGDYYNIFKLPGGKWGFIVADVVDKGAPAALYMSLTHGLIRQLVYKTSSPAALLSRVNRALYEHGTKTHFVTSFYAILDPTNSRLKYAIAGHPPPLLKKASGEVESLAGKGTAMGVFPDLSYMDLEVSLGPGESLVAFTDGMTDANNLGSESFNMDNFKDAVGFAPSSAKSMLRHLQASLGDWVKKAPTYDDITLLVIARK